MTTTSNIDTDGLIDTNSPSPIDSIVPMISLESRKQIHKPTGTLFPAANGLAVGTQCSQCTSDSPFVFMERGEALMVHKILWKNKEKS